MNQIPWNAGTETDFDNHVLLIKKNKQTTSIVISFFLPKIT